jgi:hypothetical protein
MFIITKFKTDSYYGTIDETNVSNFSLKIETLASESILFNDFVPCDDYIACSFKYNNGTNQYVGIIIIPYLLTADGVSIYSRITTNTVFKTDMSYNDGTIDLISSENDGVKNLVNVSTDIFQNSDFTLDNSLFTVQTTNLHYEPEGSLKQLISLDDSNSWNLNPQISSSSPTTTSDVSLSTDETVRIDNEVTITSVEK